MDLISRIHEKTFDKPLGIGFDELTSAENQNRFVHMLEKMNIDDPHIIEFLKD